MKTKTFTCGYCKAEVKEGSKKCKTCGKEFNYWKKDKKLKKSKKEEKIQIPESMGFFTKIKKVLLKPTEFFEYVNKENGIKSAYFYYFILLIFSTIMALIMSLFIPNFLASVLFPNLNLPSSPLTGNYRVYSTIIFGFIFPLVAIFIFVGLLHLWIMIFGGKGNYAKTFRLYVYSSTPSYLFGWIFGIGFLTILYNLILLVIGTQITHGVSKKRAIIMYVLPLILILFIIIVCVALFVAFIPKLLESLPK